MVNRIFVENITFLNTGTFFVTDSKYAIKRGIKLVGINIYILLIGFLKNLYETERRIK